MCTLHEYKVTNKRAEKQIKTCFSFAFPEREDHETCFAWLVQELGAKFKVTTFADGCEKLTYQRKDGVMVFPIDCLKD